MSSIEPLHILITGATGFIGQHLIDDLKDSGHHLRLLTRKTDPQFWCSNKNFELVKGDLTDLASLEKAFAGIDLIINLAAELKDEARFESVNVKGVENLINASAKNNVKRIIHLSSVGVVGMQYSRKEVKVGEEFPCDPKNGYERTKLESERIIRASVFYKEGRAVILRPTNVFGEHHPRQALLNFFTKVKSGKRIFFEKGAKVNYLYVKDLTGAIIHFINTRSSSSVFNVGEARNFEILWLNGCEKPNKTGKLYESGPLYFGIGETLGYFGITRIKNVMRTLSNHVIYDDIKLSSQYKYPYGLGEGLKRTIEYYKQTGKL